MIGMSVDRKQEESGEIANKLNNVGGIVCQVGYFPSGLAGLWDLRQNTRPLSPNSHRGAGVCGDPGGPLATTGSEARQTRKGATVVTESCAGVRLFGSPPFQRFVSPRRWCILAPSSRIVRHLPVCPIRF
jgi:hypothetical protein